MTFDSRWKNPQGSDASQLYLWAQELIKELRKGDYLPETAAADSSYDNATSGLTADTVQEAIDEVEARVDDLEDASRGEIIAIIEDRKTQNTAGGTFTSGADRTRTLNTLVFNRDTLVSLGSDRFTLPAGTWEIQWRAPAFKVAHHQSFLYNFTDTTEVARGSSELTNSSDDSTGPSVGVSVVTISGAKAFEIRHRCNTTNADDGFGFAANFSTEVYTRVVVRRA